MQISTQPNIDADFLASLAQPQARVALVASRFNQAITQGLINGAMAVLTNVGQLPQASIETFWVPGAFELPFLAKKVADTGRFQAVITLGCVIQGDTDHYQYVCQGVTQGLAQVAASSAIPILFGVLTCQTEQQAYARIAEESLNKGPLHKGTEVAMAALALLDQVNRL